MSDVSGGSVSCTHLGTHWEKISRVFLPEKQTGGRIVTDPLGSGMQEFQEHLWAVMINHLTTALASLNPTCRRGKRHCTGGGKGAVHTLKHHNIPRTWHGDSGDICMCFISRLPPVGEGEEEEKTSTAHAKHLPSIACMNFQGEEAG